MRSRAMLAVLAVVALLLSGCAGAGALGTGDRTLVVAIVSNPQMEDAIALSGQFERENPGIKLKFVQLPENQARAKITASTATQGGEFDVVMISNYETPQWAANGWLENLQPYIDSSEGYDPDDFIPSIRESLSHEGSMYAVPFYGESSFLAYRKDLFEKAGLTMPERPTWEQIADFAARLDDKEAGVSGICLRGKPGWGESLAPFTTVAKHVRRALVRRELERPADLAGVPRRRPVLRRPGAQARRGRRLERRVHRVRHAVRPG